MVEELPAARPARKALEDIRSASEYRAAWDIELWKAIQTERFRTLLEEQRTMALADLQRLLKAKERDAMAAVEQRQREVVNSERRVQEELRQVEKQKQRLLDMEKELRSLRRQLLEAHKRSEEEGRIQVERAMEEAVHKQALQQQRTEFVEGQLKRTEERLRRAQQDYLTLYEEFSASKTRQLAQSTDCTAQIEARLRSQLALEHAAQRERDECRHHEELRAAEQRHQKLEEDHRRLVMTLASRNEQLRRALSDVEAQRSASKLLENENRSLRGSLVHGGVAQPHLSGASVVPATTPNVGPPPAPLPRSGSAEAGGADTSPTMMSDEVVRSEICRLQNERGNLLQCSRGAYTAESQLVQRIDRRLTELHSLLVQL